MGTNIKTINGMTNPPHNRIPNLSITKK